MNYKKTIRLFDPFNGWGAHTEFHNKNSDFTTRMDTGLCNRLFHWELHYNILEKCSDIDLHLAVQSHIWPEYPLLTLPDTILVDYKMAGSDWYSEYQHANLYFRTIFDKELDTITLTKDLSKELILECYRTNNFKKILERDHWNSCIGYNTMESIYNELYGIDYNKSNDYRRETRSLSKIRLSIDSVQKNLEAKYASYVGIHIRRGNGVAVNEGDYTELSDSLKIKYEQFQRDYMKDRCDTYLYYPNEKYFKLIDAFLEIKPTQKFYISHDLPDEFLNPFYEKYGNIIESKKDVREYAKKQFQQKVNNLSHLINYGNVIDNVMDLFILSFCGYKILSPGSSWSDFAEHYKVEFSPPTHLGALWINDPILEKNNFSEEDMEEFSDKLNSLVPPVDFNI